MVVGTTRRRTRSGEPWAACLATIACRLPNLLALDMAYACYGHCGGATYETAADIEALLTPVRKLRALRFLDVRHMGFDGSPSHKYTCSDPGVLLGYGPQTFSVYTYIATSIQGPAITPIGAGLSYPSPSLSPVLLNNGSVICQQPNGSITTMVLPTHEAIARIEQRGGATPDKIRACFAQVRHHHQPQRTMRNLPLRPQLGSFSPRLSCSLSPYPTSRTLGKHPTSQIDLNSSI